MYYGLISSCGEVITKKSFKTESLAIEFYVKLKKLSYSDFFNIYSVKKIIK